MNIILTILILLTASLGWANDGMSIEWKTDWSSEFVKELEAENKELKGELIGYKIANEELKKKLEAYESTSTIHIISWPEFCEKYGHCWEYRMCVHATVGHNCSHSVCKHCGARKGIKNTEWFIEGK